MYPTIDTDDLRALVVIARHGSLKLASQILQIDPPRLVRTVNRMERNFGMRFFIRHYRRWVVTPEGRVIILRGIEILSVLHGTAEEMHVRTDILDRLSIPSMAGRQQP